jgi:3-oxoacyl-(acyl-carrier-protein) synthase
MSRNLSITGAGAVTPAGWGVEAMLAALATGEPIPPTLLERQLGEKNIITPVLRVPDLGATTPKAARLRRTSPISKFAAAAALEALGESRLALIPNGLRVGVIFTLANGCVNYSNRFFREVLADPSLASPILFPETVFNAPSSHLSAMIGSTSPNDSLIGDASGFLTGIDLAAEWLARGDVDGCLVVASEEIDWLSAEALRLYSRAFLPSEGAGAIYLEASDGLAMIHHLPDPFPYNAMDRETAALECRKALDVSDDGETLLIDSRSGIQRYDFPETKAWRDWTGPRWSPKSVLGESMGAAAALQVVAAVAALQSGSFKQVVVSSVGANQQAAGIVLVGK